MKSIFFLIVFIVSCSACSSQTGVIKYIKDTDGNTLTYIGELKDGQPDGLGMAIRYTGYVLKYVGYFKNGLFDGKGVMMTGEKEFISGDWEKGKMNGRGAHLESEGGLFVGEFAKGEREGKGVTFYPDNSILFHTDVDGNYEGHCIRIAGDGLSIADNTYSENRKSGPGCLVDLRTESMKEGVWDDEALEEKPTGYQSFLKSELLHFKKNNDVIIIGKTDSEGVLSDTAFLYDLEKKKKEFGFFYNGNLYKGVIMLDNTSYFKGTFDDNYRSKGYCNYYTIDKLYREGDFANGEMSGSNCMSIDLENDIIYCGDMKGGMQTGKAFLGTANYLYSGEFMWGSLNGSGYRLDKLGNCVRGEWSNGKPVHVIITNAYGRLIEPKTFSEGIALAYNQFKESFTTMEGMEDKSSEYADHLDGVKESIIGFPGTSHTDYPGQVYTSYIAADNGVLLVPYFKSFTLGKSKAKYMDLCKQLQAVTVKRADGSSFRLLGKTIPVPANNSPVLSKFTINGKPYEKGDFSACIVFRKNANDVYDEYEVLLAFGITGAIEKWIQGR